VRAAAPLIESGAVTLRVVDDGVIESTVRDPPQPDRSVTIEWAGGTGPQALRTACSDGGNGICAHIVATVEAVRSQTEPPGENATTELDWLPKPHAARSEVRARSVWPVFSRQHDVLVVSLVLDTPRLRGAVRDAAAIRAMMEASPADDWDAADRDVLRDESVQEAFAGRPTPRVLARALFRLARHPRLRFDDDPRAGRHPSELPEFRVDARGVRLLATRTAHGFRPLLEDAEGTRFSPHDAMLVDGPPAWLATSHAAYLLDGAFDARRVIEAARRPDAGRPQQARSTALSAATVARVAPYLAPEERSALRIVDAAEPSAEIALAWSQGALVAAVTFVDGGTGARAPFSSLGATAAHADGYVRFGTEHAAGLEGRLVNAGFVPRAGDTFALHGAERAATFVRDVLPGWSGFELRVDGSLRDIVAGATSVDLAVSARRSGESQDWFELAVDVFVGGDRKPLSASELSALLGSDARFAEVRGRLVDLERLRERRMLLTELAERRTSGLAALVALRDELHAGVDHVELPEEIERLRDRLRAFDGIERVEPPLLQNGSLRGYQERGLDFLSYLSSFHFGGILADEMGLGKALAVSCRILTPAGWRRFGDVRVGDEVMNAQGGVSRVTGVYPRGWLDGYRVTLSDGESTICSDDHLWAVDAASRRSPSRPHRVLTLKEIREHLRDAAGNARHYIPVSASMDFGCGRRLPLDPYLLGCLLGNGSATTEAFTAADGLGRGAISELLPTGTEPAVRPYRRVSRGAKPGGGSQHAFHCVPQTYKLADSRDREALLQGVLDTDGRIGLDGRIECTPASDRLARDVAFLVRSLGGVARIRHGRVSMTLPEDVRPFRLPHKADRYAGRIASPPSRAIVDVTPAGKYEMQCISVDSPDNLFVIDDFIVTHNTVQVVSHLLRRKEREGPAPSLVIAPTSVTHTWENEIARFAPSLSVLRLSSGPERAARYADVPNHDVVVTSYALARLDADTLARHRFRTLVLDEAQHAKNPASQIARVVRSLQAGHRLALTGTPVENSLRDLWALFAFLEPGLLGSAASFRRRFELPVETGDERAAATLRSRLEPFVLRRTKDEVAPELPERIEVELECDLTPLQRRLYAGVAEAARRDVFARIDADGIERSTVHVLAALTRLRQICAHPGLVFAEHRDDPEASGKLDAFLETVDEVLAGGHRLLVFSAFASMLRILRERLDEKGLGYGYLDGATPDRDRRDEVERFMRPDGPPLFLCSLKAGGVGLTLTAADYVILYDPWWNPAVERQAIDRAHRIGQHRTVTAYRLIASGSVEQKIRALAERKADLSRNVIQADGTAAKSLTRADLELLFADPG
jgi:superfamily II DNA or RNA helicase